jgi:hypothetical protein
MLIASFTSICTPCPPHPPTHTARNLKDTPPQANSTVVRVVVRPCQAGELNQTSRSVCLRCPAGQFGLDPNQHACSNCPTHATCPGGALMLPDTGYWQSSPRSTEFHKCLQPGVCRCVRCCWCKTNTSTMRCGCAVTSLPKQRACLTAMKNAWGPLISAQCVCPSCPLHLALIPTCSTSEVPPDPTGHASSLAVDAGQPCKDFSVCCARPLLFRPQQDVTCGKYCCQAGVLCAPVLQINCRCPPSPHCIRRGISVEALQCSAGPNKTCNQPANATQYQALQCREGYSGNLCATCQVDGEVRYSRLLRFKCSR